MIAVRPATPADFPAIGDLRVAVWTQPSMAAAHRLYERLGFARTAARVMLGPTGNRVLVYELELGGSNAST